MSSDFARKSIGMMRSAERALAGYPAAEPAMYDDAAHIIINKDVCCVGAPQQDSTADVLRQLQVAMTEVANLRNELAAERDARTHTLTSMARRWKEEMMVEMQQRDLATRRELANLREEAGNRLSEEGCSSTLLRRQVEDILRQFRVRDTTTHNQHDSIVEELQDLRTKVEMVSSLSSTTRIECAQLMERERAALAHRLDVELMRFAEMRRDDRSAIHAAKDFVEAEMQRLRQHVAELVQEAWKPASSALESSMRDELRDVTMAIADVRGAARRMDEKVEQCVQTCQAESRLQTAALKERIATLESSSAVVASRIDRAERKADRAHEVVSRVDASVDVAKEVSEKATASAQRAGERAQRVEDCLMDRDARLNAVETQLACVATAESLRAEVEMTKQRIARAESAMEASKIVCERSEAMTEQCGKQMLACKEKVEEIHKTCGKAQVRVSEAMELAEVCVRRMAVVEDAKDGLTQATERVEHIAMRLDQRVESCEQRIVLLRERHEQGTKEVLGGLQSLSARMESAQEFATRAESVSAAAKAESDRLEKRLVRVESGASATAAELVQMRATMEEHGHDISTTMQRQQQSSASEKAREARMEEQLHRLERDAKDSVEVAEKRINDHVAHMANSVKEHVSESVMQEVSNTLLAHFNKYLQRKLAEMYQKTKEMLTNESTELRQQQEAMAMAVNEVREVLQKLPSRFATSEEVAALRRSLSALDASLRSLTTTTEEKVEQLSTNTSSRAEVLERDQQRCRSALEALQADITQCAEALSQHTHAQQQHVQQQQSLARRLTAVEQSAADASSAAQGATQHAETCMSAVRTLSSTTAALQRQMAASALQHNMVVGVVAGASSISSHGRQSGGGSSTSDRRNTWSADAQHVHGVEEPTTTTPQSLMPMHDVVEEVPPTHIIEGAVSCTPKQTRSEEVPTSHSATTATTTTRNIPPPPPPATTTTTTTSTMATSTVKEEEKLPTPGRFVASSARAAPTDTTPTPIIATPTTTTTTSAAPLIVKRFEAVDDTTTTTTTTSSADAAPKRVNVHQMDESSDITTESMRRAPRPSSSAVADASATPPPSDRAEVAGRRTATHSAWGSSSSSNASRAQDVEEAAFIHGGEAPRSQRSSGGVGGADVPQTLQSLIDTAEILSQHSSRVSERSAGAQSAQRAAVAQANQREAYDDWDDDDDDDVGDEDHVAGGAGFATSADITLDEVQPMTEEVAFHRGDADDAVIPLTTADMSGMEGTGDAKHDEDDDDDAVHPHHPTVSRAMQIEQHTPRQTASMVVEEMSASITPTAVDRTPRRNDAELAMVSTGSPTPAEPRSVSATPGGTVQQLTPRKTFVAPLEDEPLQRESIPRHGTATTSSSSGTRSSASASRPSGAPAAGGGANTDSSSITNAPVATSARQPSTAANRPRMFTSFDDSSSEEDA